MKTKTSLTIDGALFERAESLSKKLRLSRSELYERAIEDFIRVTEERDVTERINAAEASLSADARAEGDAVVAFLGRAALRSLEAPAAPDTW